MVEKGARHLTFISRSSLDKPEAVSAIEDLRRMVAEPEVIRCSITDEAAVEEVVNRISDKR